MIQTKPPISPARLADFILAGGVVVCLLALSHVFYYYGWTGQRKFQSSTDSAIYYGLPAVLATLLFVSFRLRPGYRIILAICCLFAVGLMYGYEAFLYQYRPYKARLSKAEVVELAEQSGVQFDTRDRIQVIADLRKERVDAVSQVNLFLRLDKQRDGSMNSTINIRGNEIMPLAGIAEKVTIACNQSGQYLMYKTDEHGFHNPTGIWQPESIDITAVGNSLTLGYCVPSDKNFVALIRARYPATLNLGIPGAGPLHILAILKEYAQPVKPRLVLWFFMEAVSFTELQVEKRNRMLMRYLSDDFTQDLIGRQSDADEALSVDIKSQTAVQMNDRSRSQESSRRLTDEFLKFMKLSGVRQKLGLVDGPTALQELSKLEFAELRPDLSLLEDILSEAKSRVAAWGGKLYFIYLPSWERYGQSHVIGVKARRQVLTLVSTLGIPLIDSYPAFQSHGDPLSLFPFRAPGHYNQEGHRLVAETVLNNISRVIPTAPRVNS